jgi:hypothetical protein
MLVEIHDALKEAGASEDKARDAATSLSGCDPRFDWDTAVALLVTPRPPKFRCANARSDSATHVFEGKLWQLKKVNLATCSSNASVAMS